MIFKINYLRELEPNIKRLFFEIYRHENTKDVGGMYNIDSRKIWPKKSRLISGIYLLFCTGNGKVYVGQSNCIYNRISIHSHSLRNNKHPNIYLQNAYNKYGKDSFYFTILEEVLEKDKLNDTEIKWIEAYNSLVKGFNISPVLKNVVISPVGPGITTRGENHYSAKLTNQDVKNICISINNNTPLKELSEIYGVSATSISGIKNGHKWRHITNDFLGKEKMNDRRLLEHLEVAKICIMLNRGVNQRYIAKEFGVSGSFIGQIRRGERHKEIGHLYLYYDTSTKFPNHK